MRGGHGNALGKKQIKGKMRLVRYAQMKRVEKAKRFQKQIWEKGETKQMKGDLPSGPVDEGGFVEETCCCTHVWRQGGGKDPGNTVEEPKYRKGSGDNQRRNVWEK